MDSLRMGLAISLRDGVCQPSQRWCVCPLLKIEFWRLAHTFASSPLEAGKIFYLCFATNDYHISLTWLAICIRMFLLCLQNWRTFTVHFPRDLCVCKHAWMFPKNSTLVQSPKLTSVEKTCPLQTVKMLTSSCQHKIGVQLKAQSLFHRAFCTFLVVQYFCKYIAHDWQ